MAIEIRALIIFEKLHARARVTSCGLLTFPQLCQGSFAAVPSAWGVSCGGQREGEAGSVSSLRLLVTCFRSST